MRCTDFKSLKKILDFIGFFQIFFGFFGFFSGLFWVYEDFINKKNLNTEFQELFTPK